MYLRWELVAPMTVARSNLGVGCVEGRIVVAGGYKGDDVTCSAEIYNKVGFIFCVIVCNLKQL